MDKALIKVTETALTPLDQAVVKASKTRRVKDIPESELWETVKTQLQIAVRDIGHSPLGDSDLEVLVNRTTSNLINKFPAITEGEFKHAVNLGSLGEFKSKPDEFLMVSVASVYNWIKSYQSIRREAVAKVVEPEPEKVWTQEEIEAVERRFIGTFIMEPWKESKKTGKAVKVKQDLAGGIFDIFEKKGILKPSNEQKIKTYTKIRERLKSSLSKSNYGKSEWFYIDQYREDGFDKRPKHEKERNPFFTDAVRMTKQEIIRQYFQTLLDSGQELTI